MSKLSVINLLTTFITNGFNIDKVDRLAHENLMLHIYKYDRLGAKVKYSILFTEDDSENSITDTLLSQSKNYESTPLIVSDYFESGKCKSYDSITFFNFFGGIINSGLVLIPKLSEILDSLGHNSLPSELSGKADDLHEMYVKECLQFVMESPTRRYGMDRTFESLPDTAVLCKDGFMLLVDSKAYSNGYSFSADDLKRYKSYVDDFTKRYSQFLGPIFSFVLVSGYFTDSNDSIQSRSDEFYKMCQCKISCIQSKELGIITEFLSKSPALRSAINWKNIFSELIISNKTFQKEINRIKKDNIA